MASSSGHAIAAVVDLAAPVSRKDGQNARCGSEPDAKELREAGRVCAQSPAQQNGHLCGKAGLHWLIPPNGMLRFQISLRESSEPSRSED